MTEVLLGAWALAMTEFAAYELLMLWVESKA